ncbi:RtcB family protein [Streptomyces sp. 900116325]
MPGTMGTASYVMAPTAGNDAFWSSAHGADRVWSRHQALRRVRGEQLCDEPESHGIAVRPISRRALAKEAPDAYKDVDDVAAAATLTRLVPLGVVAG